MGTSINHTTIQITAGRGPVECCWVVAQVLKQFLETARKYGVKYIVLHRETGIENGTVRSATVQLNGKDLQEFLKPWIGTIQWIGQSQFRKLHKRKNWFIGFCEIDQYKLTAVKEKDILFQTMRSSGPGGQNVNKVNSAVRATHQPTGIQVVAMDSRSQRQNKKLAIERLIVKVNETQLEIIKTEITQQWENHLSIKRGDPVRIFRGSDFKRKKNNKSYAPKRQQLKNDLKKQLWD